MHGQNAQGNPGGASGSQMGSNNNMKNFGLVGPSDDNANNGVVGLVDKFYNVGDGMEGLAGKFNTSSSKDLDVHNNKNNSNAQNPEVAN